MGTRIFGVKGMLAILVLFFSSCFCAKRSLITELSRESSLEVALELCKENDIEFGSACEIHIEEPNMPGNRNITLNFFVDKLSIFLGGDMILEPDEFFIKLDGNCREFSIAFSYLVGNPEYSVTRNEYSKLPVITFISDDPQSKFLCDLKFIGCPPNPDGQLLLDTNGRIDLSRSEFYATKQFDEYSLDTDCRFLRVISSETTIFEQSISAIYSASGGKGSALCFDSKPDGFPNRKKVDLPFYQINRPNTDTNSQNDYRLIGPGDYQLSEDLLKIGDSFSSSQFISAIDINSLRIVNLRLYRNEHVPNRTPLILVESSQPGSYFEVDNCEFDSFLTESDSLVQLRGLSKATFKNVKFQDELIQKGGIIEFDGVDVIEMSNLQFDGNYCVDGAKVMCKGGNMETTASNITFTQSGITSPYFYSDGSCEGSLWDSQTECPGGVCSSCNTSNICAKVVYPESECYCFDGESGTNEDSIDLQSRNYWYYGILIVGVICFTSVLCFLYFYFRKKKPLDSVKLGYVEEEESHYE